MAYHAPASQSLAFQSYLPSSWRLRGVLAAALFVLAACGGGSDDPPATSGGATAGTATAGTATAGTATGGNTAGTAGTATAGTATAGTATAGTATAGTGDIDIANPPTTPDPTILVGQRYRLTFTATWSMATHPLNFPGNPHFSGLIGAVHSEQVRFWERGQIASAGVQEVAETGAKPDFRTEIDAAIAAGTARSVIDGGGIQLSPGAVSVEFSVFDDYPEITVISMLAPSPDWFIGVQNLSLMQNGAFVDQLSVDLRLYDAGSDDGTQYESPNAATLPLSPVSLLSSDPADAPFVNGEPIVGTLTIERL